MNDMNTIKRLLVDAGFDNYENWKFHAHVLDAVRALDNGDNVKALCSLDEALAVHHGNDRARRLVIRVTKLLGG